MRKARGRAQARTVQLEATMRLPVMGDELELRAERDAIERALVLVSSDRFPAMSAGSASVRLSAIQLHWNKYQELYAKVTEGKNEEDRERMQGGMVATEESFLTVSGAFREKMGVQPVVENAATVVELKMPFKESDIKNTWGFFDGTLRKWPGFKDRFVAAVHANAEISAAFKFQHLVKSLTGKAAETLGEWQLTAEGYNLAWERLLELYDKKYAICQDILRTFFRLPVLEGPPQADKLQIMANVAHETLRQLKAQGIPVEAWDMVIVHCLHERLDAETAREWELARKSETPEATEMLRFLDQQASALCRGRKPGRMPAERGERHERHETSGRRDKSERRERLQVNKLPCSWCRSLAHPIWECGDFRGLTLQMRREVTSEKKLCCNCLKEGHYADACFQKPCANAKCSGYKHNSLLCPEREKFVGRANNAPKRKLEDARRPG